jgi:hypothetical protein
VLATRGDDARFGRKAFAGFTVAGLIVAAG